MSQSRLKVKPHIFQDNQMATISSMYKEVRAIQA